MKELRKNIKYLLGIMVICFVLLTGYLIYDAVIWGNRWLNSPYNPRLQEQRATVTPGNIYDRTGALLVGTKNGSRTYADSKTQRYATCHILGDARGLCATGVENTHAAELLGYNTDFFSTIRQFIRQDSTRGADITLTADASLCKTAYQAMDGQKGAVVLMNYKTGEILAMTSTPGFDPKHLDAADLSEGSSVLVNRAVQGRYTPGSVLKTVTLACALEHGVGEGWNYTCSGALALEGDTVTCSSAHGEVTLEEAYAQSCNCAFARLGVQLGAEALTETARNMGFFRDIAYPDFTLYASKLDIMAQSLPSEIGWAAVGQDKDTVTPLGICLITAGIANGGLVKQPRLVKTSPLDVSQLAGNLQDNRIVSGDVARQIQAMMAATVESGTGTRAAISGVTVCGKTGTAEVGGGKSPHAWFTGFIRDAEHPMAVAVIVENGGSGGRVAAPLAKKVLNAAIKAGY